MSTEQQSAVWDSEIYDRQRKRGLRLSNQGLLVALDKPHLTNEAQDAFRDILRERGYGTFELQTGTKE